MSSRDEILAKVLAGQGAVVALPSIPDHPILDQQEVFAKFSSALANIGGQVIVVADLSEINKRYYTPAERVVTNIAGLAGDHVMMLDIDSSAHDLADVDVAIIRAHFAVAENGAVWVTENLMGNRALPYICQHLAVVVNVVDIVSTLHEAYDKIGNSDYDFGAFIAGPSKTADIEQSLVIGAHGSRSMTVYLISHS